MIKEPDPDARFRTRDAALNEARGVLNGTDPTSNEIAIVAYLISRGNRPADIRDYVVRSRAIYSR